MKLWIIIGVFIVLAVVVGAVYMNLVNENNMYGEGDMDEGMTGDETEYMDINVMEAQEIIDKNPDLVIIDVSPRYDKGTFAWRN
jgi:flagellar basal body-associated protein FliL